MDKVLLFYSLFHCHPPATSFLSHFSPLPYTYLSSLLYSFSSYSSSSLRPASLDSTIRIVAADMRKEAAEESILGGTNRTSALHISGARKRGRAIAEIKSGLPSTLSSFPTSSSDLSATGLDRAALLSSRISLLPLSTHSAQWAEELILRGERLALDAAELDMREEHRLRAAYN